MKPNRRGKQQIDDSAIAEGCQQGICGKHRLSRWSVSSDENQGVAVLEINPPPLGPA